MNVRAVNPSFTEPADERAGHSEEGPLPSLVVVAPWVYHEQCGIGGGVLCYRVLRELRHAFRIHFVSFDTTANDLEGGKLALLQICETVNCIDLPAPAPIAIRLANALFGAGPGGVQNARSDVLARKLSSLVAAHRPCAVLFQFPEMAQFVAAVPADQRTIIDTQDVAAVSRFREFQNARGLVARWIKGFNWICWARYELATYRKASALIAISDTDQAVLRAFLPGAVTHLSAPAVDFPPVARRPVAGRVCMVGNFAHAPNRDGAQWLMKSVWPLVRRTVPDATLSLVGPHSPSSDDTDRSNGISSFGFVDDLAAIFATAAVSVVPYRFGGGVKIKALEAFAARCPVVATPIGAEGLGALDAVHLRVALSAESFADAIVETLSDATQADRLANNAYQLARERFSWSSKVAALIAIVDDDRSRRARTRIA